MADIIHPTGPNLIPRIYVLCNSDEAFRLFKATQKGSAAPCFRIEDLPDFKRKVATPGAMIVVAGPFWRIPGWDRYCEVIRSKTLKSPGTAIHWFPM